MSNAGMSLPELSLQYLRQTGEHVEYKAGYDKLSTPFGEVEVWGRALVGGELETLIPYSEELESENGRLALAYLLTGDLENDYLVLLDASGQRISSLPEEDSPGQAKGESQEQKHCSFLPFQSPGLFRKFHLSLYLYYMKNQLAAFHGSCAAANRLRLEQLLSPLFGRLSTGSGSLRCIDDWRYLLARPNTSFTQTAVATVMGLLLGCTVMAREGLITMEEELPVFYFTTRAGKLRMCAGELARLAFLDPFWQDALSKAATATGEVVNNPGAVVAYPFDQWVSWEDLYEHSACFESEGHYVLSEAIRLGRQRREQDLQAALAAGEQTTVGANEAYKLVMVWRCSYCEEFFVLERQLTQPTGISVVQAHNCLRESLPSVTLGVPCTCKRLLFPESLQYVLLAKYLPGADCDLIWQLGRLEDERLVEAWGLRRGVKQEQSESYQTLPGAPVGSALWPKLGRFDSPLACAKDCESLLKSCPKQWQTLDNSDKVLELGGVSRLRLENEHQAELYTASTQTWSTPGLEGHAWYCQPQTKRRYLSCVLSGSLGPRICLEVDWERYLELVRSLTATKFGLQGNEHLAPVPDKPGRLCVADSESWVCLEVEEDLRKGLATGWYPEDIVSFTVNRAYSLRQDMARALAHLRNSLGEEHMRLLADQGLLEVTEAKGETALTRTYELLPILNAPEGPQARVRFMFDTGAFSMFSCNCGKPSYISVRLKSEAQWRALSPAQQQELIVRRPEESLALWQRSLNLRIEEERLVFPAPDEEALVPAAAAFEGERTENEANTCVQYYVKCCEDHVSPISPQDLAGSGFSLSELEAMYRRDLDRAVAKFALYRFTEHKAMLVVGRGAGSLAVEPMLVRGVVEAYGLPLEPVFTICVERENALGIFEGIPAAQLRDTIMLKIEALLGPEWDKGQRLVLRRSVTCQEARGHFSPVRCEDL